MISTYNPERIEHLSLIIRHLLQSDQVHTVFITWHNPALQVPASLYQDISEKDYERVKVLGQTFDSLNNRFNPVDELKTDAVYIMDDDIYVDLDDLKFTFSVSGYEFCLASIYWLILNRYGVLVKIALWDISLACTLMIPPQKTLPTSWLEKHPIASF